MFSVYSLCGRDFDKAIQVAQDNYNALIDYQLNTLNDKIPSLNSIQRKILYIPTEENLTHSNDYFIRNKDEIKKDLARALFKAQTKKEMLEEMETPVQDALNNFLQK